MSSPPSSALDNSAEDILERIALLTRLIPELHQKLLAERANPPESSESLEAQIAAVRFEVDKLQAKVDREKGLAKKRKKEIDDWKTWYNSNPHIDKTEARDKLTVEIAWRAEEIAVHERAIAQLESEKLSGLAQLEELGLSLKAFVDGLFALPVDEDPRLIEAKAALAEAQAQLQALQQTA